MLRKVLIVTAGDHRAKSETFTGWFHCWAGLSERPIAIVEREDGRVYVTNLGDQIMFAEPYTDPRVSPADHPDTDVPKQCPRCGSENAKYEGDKEGCGDCGYGLR